jgi:hypothetical protein
MRTIITEFKYTVPYLNALRSLGNETHIINYRYFDLFFEFKPEVVFCTSNPHIDLLKCIKKYKPIVFSFLTEQVNNDFIPYVHSFLTDNPGLSLDSTKVNLKVVPPAFDSIRFSRREPFSGVTYLGDFDPSLDFILRATQDTNLRIIGGGWPTRSLGRFTDETAMKAYSGHCLCFSLESILNTYGCGGNPIYRAGLGFPGGFETYDEMLAQIKNLPITKFDITPHTYVERLKTLIS